MFHLGLQWHHFYDLSTTQVALAADGVFHAVGWFVTVWGLFLLADVRRRTEVSWSRWVGAVVVGVGASSLDGVLNHKILGIHQIRYGVDLLVYDVVWIGTAVVALAVGLVVLRRAARSCRRRRDRVMPPHDHVASGGPALLTVVAVVALAVGAAAYAAGLRAARSRSPWPVRRTLSWYAGLVSAGVAVVGPLADASRSSFTAHMAGHVLLGMLAPLLLVLAAPVSLLLRALPPARARRVAAVLRSPCRASSGTR